MGGIGLSYPACFFGVVSMSPKYVALALGISLLAFDVSLYAAEQGFLEGHLKIIFGMAAQPSDDMPRPEIAPESYAEYPLVVLNQENNKEIARLTADGQGNYRVSLPAGNYVLDVQDRVRKRVRARPQQFSVVSNQIVRVDMNVVIGVGFH
jgi:hypothetical protein